MGVVYNQGVESPVTNVIEEVIPEPPVVVSKELVEAVASNGEVPFTSMGLGGWSPIGMVEQCLEWLHITADLPWWGAIAIGKSLFVNFRNLNLILNTIYRYCSCKSIDVSISSNSTKKRCENE